jgi:hypothetical protein
MKLLYIFISVLALASCSKKDDTKATCPIKVYMRVQAVEPSGDTTYSNIMAVEVR